MENNIFIQYWTKSSMRNFNVILGVAAVVSQIIGQISNNPKMFILGDIVAIFCIFHYFIHGYFHRQQKFVTDNQKNYSLPQKKINKIGSSFLCGFMMFICMGMTISKEIYNGSLFNKIKTMFIYLISSLLKMIFNTDGLGKDDLIVQNNNNLLGVMNQFSPKNQSPWENLMNYIQTILIIIGVIFLFVLCIMIIINNIKKLFYKNKFSISKNNGKNITDKEQKIAEEIPKKEKILDFSPTAKIRRIYKHSINKKCKRGHKPAKCFTPSEIEEYVSLPKEEAYKELHYMYEKARYSKFGCDEEDGKKAKALKL